MKIKPCRARKDRGCICITFVFACVVGETLKTPIWAPWLMTPVTWGGIGGLGSPVYISVFHTVSSYSIWYCQYQISYLWCRHFLHSNPITGIFYHQGLLGEPGEAGPTGPEGDDVSTSGIFFYFCQFLHIGASILSFGGDVFKFVNKRKVLSLYHAKHHLQ